MHQNSNLTFIQTHLSYQARAFRKKGQKNVAMEHKVTRVTLFLNLVYQESLGPIYAQ